MKDEDKITKALATILQQTQDGTLDWGATEIPKELEDFSSEVIKAVYETEYKHRVLRLFTYRRKCYYEEDLFYWEDNVALELSDDSQSSWWRFPKNVILWDLLEAVEFKTVGVEDFIDNIISGEEEEEEE